MGHAWQRLSKYRSQMRGRGRIDGAPEDVWHELKAEYVAILEERGCPRERSLIRLGKLEEACQCYRDTQSELWNRHAMAREDSWRHQPISLRRRLYDGTWVSHRELAYNRNRMLVAEQEQRRVIRSERRFQKWNQRRFAKEDNIRAQRRTEIEEQRKFEQFNRRATAREDVFAHERRLWESKCKQRVAEIECLLQKWRLHRVRITQKEERRQKHMTAQKEREAVKTTRSATRESLRSQLERRALLRRRMRRDETMDEILGPRK